MSPEDYVVFILDPDLYGVGKVLEVLAPAQDGTGRLRVDFDGDVNEFGAFELELASVWAGRRQTMGEAA